MMIQHKIDNLDGNLEIGKKYRIKKLGRKDKEKVDVEGNLVEVRKDFYVFYDRRGFRECFLKVDFIIGEYQIKEVS